LRGREGEGEGEGEREGGREERGKGREGERDREREEREGGRKEEGEREGERERSKTEGKVDKSSYEMETPTVVTDLMTEKSTIMLFSRPSESIPDSPKVSFKTSEEEKK
jgi:hypothetical protein